MWGKGSVDGGEQWMAATLDPPTAHAAWRFWSYAWTVPMSGRYARLFARPMDLERFKCRSNKILLRTVRPGVMRFL